MKKIAVNIYKFIAELIEVIFKSDEQWRKEYRFALWLGAKKAYDYAGYEGLREIISEAQKDRDKKR